MRFTYRGKDALLPTAMVPIECTEGIIEYAAQIGADGLHGNTINDVLLNLVRESIEAHAAKGRVTWRRYELRKIPASE